MRRIVGYYQQADGRMLVEIILAGSCIAARMRPEAGTTGTTR